MKKSLLVLCSAAISLMTVSCSKSNGDSDETTGNWITQSAFDGKPRMYASVFVINDADVYIGMGFNRGELNGAYAYRDLWKYNPTNTQWELKTTLPAGARSRYGAVGFAVGNKGYIGLGQDSLNNPLSDFYQYDPATQSFKAIAPYPASDGRYLAVGFGIKDTGYVGSGSNSGGSYKDFYKYDPNTNTWTAIESCPGDKRNGSVAFVSADTAGYVVTGINTGSVTLNTDFAYYKPADGHWHSLRPIYNKSTDSYDDDYSDIKRTEAAIFKIGDYAYLSTGGTGSGTGAFNKTWRYDIKADQWNRRTPFEKAVRVGAVGFSFSGRGFIGLGGTGLTGTQQYDDMNEFNPTETYDSND